MYHGHTGVTADYPNAIYHYHVTNSDPYINGNGYYGTQEQYLIRPFLSLKL
jgi:hypothetical protein